MRTENAMGCRNKSQREFAACRCKMRMSGLCKVEMSAFIGGRGRHGNGANRLEPTRTGPPAHATRGQSEANHADRSRQTAEDQRYFNMKVGIFRGGCLTGPSHSGVELQWFAG